jgi:hypothetical protein
MTIRIAQQDEYVGDVFVPKGTLIYIPVRGLSFPFIKHARH